MNPYILGTIAVLGWAALMVTIWALMRDSARRDQAQEEAIKEWREGL